MRNPHIELAVRNADCSDCKLRQQAEGQDVCVTAEGNHKASVLVVSKTPLGKRAKKELHTYLERAGFDPEELAYTGAVKCLVWDLAPGKKDIKACREYLHKEIEFIQPDWILCIGGEALTAVTGKSGIMKYRGQLFPAHTGATAMATISPAMVYRNPGQKGGFEADLKFFYNQVNETEETEHIEPHADEYIKVDTKEKLKEYLSYLSNAGVMSIDLETSEFDEFADDARIITLATTLMLDAPGASQTLSGTKKICFSVPLFHHESPWQRQWKKVFSIITPYLEQVPKVVAHNGKFDLRWLRQFGCYVKLTFDTMLAAHLLDENRPKGLKPLARTLLGAPPWDIHIKNSKTNPWYTLQPLDDILWYNGLDTWHTLNLYLVLKEQLNQPENKRVKNIFTRLNIPASESFTDIERRGVWMDSEQLYTNWHIAEQERQAIDDYLMTFVPEDHGWPKVNFRPSNFLKWWLFEYLELPIIRRGKAKEDGSPGDPSTAEDVMLELRDKHEVIPKLIERAKWEKYISSFFSAYAEQLDESSRIHTTFKIAGTVTGRMSSGKADEEKVTSKRQIRGVNLQQVPRDEFVRGIFGAPPGYSFVEADYSQIELRVAAFLAQEPTLLNLYATGQDVHMAMAMRMTGKPASEVTAEERKKAKAVNFGFLFGMGWRKFIQTAWENYGVRVTEEEAQAARKQFFDQFSALQKWHAQQRRLATQYGRVVSPIGRIRHLPDIYSSDPGVKAEAERQAINSPVQGFASDMTLLSMILLDRKFKKYNMTASCIGTVHDAINFEIPDFELSTALPMIKDTMEQLPLKRLFGVDLNLPIVADVKLGTRWGGARELEPHEVYHWKAS